MFTYVSPAPNSDSPSPLFLHLLPPAPRGLQPALLRDSRGPALQISPQTLLCCVRLPFTLHLRHVRGALLLCEVPGHAPGHQVKPQCVCMSCGPPGITLHIAMSSVLVLTRACQARSLSRIDRLLLCLEVCAYVGRGNQGS